MTADEETPDLAGEIDLNIGRNLKRAREARGISQADFARLITETGIRGVHQTTVARIESGQRALRAAEAVAIGRVLETSVEMLAESGTNAHIRAFVRSISEAGDTFDSALRELIKARLLAAQHLDRAVPYGSDSETPFEEVLKSGIDPQLYELLESRIVSASPRERLAAVLFNEKQQVSSYARPPGTPHKQRVEFILDEYLDEGSDDGEHPTAP